MTVTRILRLVQLGALCLFGLAGQELFAEGGGSDCERLVGVSVVGGNVVYKDVAICMPAHCPGPVICDERILVVSVPLTYGCNCGVTGNACTVAYVGTPGGTGSAYCYNNSCASTCPAPQLADRDNDGVFDTFTSGGVTWTVVTCPCPS